MKNNIKYFATCPAGCEKLLEQELLSLGLADLDQQKFGVHFSGDSLSGPMVCLKSRIANRVLLPIAEFKAHDADTVYSGSKKIRWEEYLSSLNTFAIHGIGTNENITHSGFLALKIKDALVDRMRKVIGKRPNVDKFAPDVKIVAKFHQNRLAISLDMSGDSLHKRGWRSHNSAAPLKENLAAAILFAAGYTGDQTLLDPMCGSATLLIEAAEIAHGLAAGRNKTFGFEKWPTIPKSLKRQFDAVRREELNKKLEDIPSITGSDNSFDALRIAADHLDNSGLADYIHLEHGDALDAKIEDNGLLVANPPYGERLEIPEDELFELYRNMGHAWRDIGNARLAIFCANPDFRKAFSLKPSSFYDMHNGPIATRLFIYEVGEKHTGKRD